MLLLTKLDIDVNDHYEVLGIPKDATMTDIRRAYLRKSKLHHPDKGGDPEMFRKVREAYDVLSDKKRRFVYDTVGLSERELTFATSMLVDLLVAAFRQGFKTEKKVKAFILEIIIRDIKQKNKEIAEARGVVTELEQIKAEINDDNYIMQLALQRADEKLRDLERHLTELKEAIKNMETMKKLVPHINLKTKDEPMWWADTQMMGMQPRVVFRI